MDKKWGKESLWDVARKTIEDFAYFLQKNYNVEMGLRVYGHQYSYVENNCEDSKLEVPIMENSASKIASKLKTIKNQGTTPLTYSLEKAAEDLGCNSKKNMIILITDGFETCNRDPCAMAEKLLDYRISIKPLIVGLNIDPKEIQHLHCIGDFRNTKNKEEFKKELINSFTTIANRRSFSVFLKNDSKQISESNIPFSVFNAKNKELISSYYHHLAPNNLPDTIMIGNYDSVFIKLHTTPVIYSEVFKLKKYRHNLLTIDYPKSSIELKWKTTSQKMYDPIVGLIYRDSAVIDKFNLPAKMDLVKDTYSFALNTIPPLFYKQIDLVSNRFYSIEFPTTGLLTVSYSSHIYGDIYYYKLGVLTKCYTLNSTKNIENLHLLPGKYKLIYRSQRSITIHGTFEKEFMISSGLGVNLAL